MLQILARSRARVGERFVDLGAGLGHVVLLVALLAGVRARGVEIEPDAPEPYEFRTKAAGLLIVLPALFASIGPALLAANLLAWLIRPWRRTLDREGKESRGDDFVSAQRGLMKGSLVVLVAMAPLMVFGVLLGHR